MGLGGFEIATANGGKAELPTPGGGGGGASREVTLDNRLEFVDLAEAFKMREYRVPVRRKISRIVVLCPPFFLFLCLDTAGSKGHFFVRRVDVRVLL